ncbi:Slp1p [Sugiyamaella lignohabitans]|uniref:SUN-like protein 1 n=1 Tax=Sugiyamaella lignohabitans TaxID=796027 RepID=A0A167EGA4_9ASCO|nr:Slp1p [Sugiyamaella lignohabitans]ANB14045.1 Slp1p [Sugiyamaella lignohabitans]
MNLKLRYKRRIRSLETLAGILTRLTAFSLVLANSDVTTAGQEGNTLDFNIIGNPNLNSDQNTYSTLEKGDALLAESPSLSLPSKGSELDASLLAVTDSAPQSTSTIHISTQIRSLDTQQDSIANFSVPSKLSDISYSQSSTVSVSPAITPSSSATSSTDESTTRRTEQLMDEEIDQFLSFEEWRKLNLEKSGQSEKDLIPRQQQQNDLHQNMKRPAQYDGNFIGDELEIEMDLFKRSSDGKESNDPKSEGKLYKTRFNYASFDCAATIVKSNSHAKGVSNILSENKDSYLINKCSESNKFFIIELCQDILVDQVSMANYEFFSSMFRRIRISVADRFPAPESSWKVLGEFEAQSVRDIQSFDITNPLIWARYLRVEVLSHWGHEYYCPVSLVRVHGTTMMDEYKNQDGAERDKKADDDRATPVVDNKSNAVSFPESLHSTLNRYSSPIPSSIDDIVSTTSVFVAKTLEPNAYSIDSLSQLSSPEPSVGSEHRSVEAVDPDESNSGICEPGYKSIENTYDQLRVFYPGHLISPLVLNESCQWDDYMNNHSIQLQNGNASSDSIIQASESVVQHDVTTPSTPKTQDSIYQTIMKRLSLLESNTTLSLQYVEMQSQSLRELLVKIEKRQSTRIENFFEEFNRTVTEQIRSFQFQYSRLLLSTVDEMEAQRHRTEEDVLSLSTRLSLIADELVYQKKLSIAQAVILLVVLIFVIATRTTPIDSSLAMAVHGNQAGIRDLWKLSNSMRSPTRVLSPKRNFDRSHHRVASTSSAEWYDEVYSDRDYENTENLTQHLASNSTTPRNKHRQVNEFPFPTFSSSPRPRSLQDMNFNDSETDNDTLSPN